MMVSLIHLYIRSNKRVRRVKWIETGGKEDWVSLDYEMLLDNFSFLGLKLLGKNDINSIYWCMDNHNAYI